MASEIQDFYLSVSDLFSIILPGAILTFLINLSIGTKIPAELYSNLNSFQKMIMFLCISYIVGHFVSGLGSIIDKIYYKFDKGFKKQKKIRIAVENKIKKIIGDIFESNQEGVKSSCDFNIYFI